ncbi:MAG: serine/threonine-protein kinase [Myxococcota bacterium]
MSTDPTTAPPAPDADWNGGDERDDAGALGPDTLAPGTLVGAYRIVALIGRGGMGEVYEAWDDRLARPVALKRIPVLRQADGEARARFWREARTLAALRHPGIVTIFEIGEDPTTKSLYLAMELVRGRPLSTLGPRPMPPRLAVHLVREVALALGAAHAAGVTHRDIKPPNILVEDDGAVRVVDFGLARRVDELDERLTRSGTLIGTPGYMAPESVLATPSAREGAVVSSGPPADVFALGTLLYRLLAGVHPFVRESAQATAMAVAGALHTPLGALGLRLPPSLVAVVERCLALAPAERPADGRALAEALARVELPAAAGDDRQALAALFGRLAPTATADQPFDTQHPAAASAVASPVRRGLALALATVVALAAALLALASGGGSSNAEATTPPPGPARAAAGPSAPTPAPAPAPAAHRRWRCRRGPRWRCSASAPSARPTPRAARCWPTSCACASTRIRRTSCRRRSTSCARSSRPARPSAPTSRPSGWRGRAARSATSTWRCAAASSTPCRGSRRAPPSSWSRRSARACSTRWWSRRPT